MLLNRLIDKITFFDYEDYTPYWDEAVYRSVEKFIRENQSPEERADATSQRLRRLAFQNFSDTASIPAPEGNVRYYLGKNEVTSEFIGKFARICQSDVKACCIFDMDDPLYNTKILVIQWRNGIQYAPIAIQSDISDIPSIHKWFSVNRSSARQFNPDYGKHGAKEYVIDNVTVSPLTITEQQRDHALRHSIGIPGSKRLFDIVPEENLLIIFSYENRKTPDQRPIYHGHQVKLEKKSELHRLPPVIFKRLAKLYRNRKFF